MPFEAWHLEWLTLQTAQAWLALTPQYGLDLKQAGPCFSAFAGPTVIACAGVMTFWPGRAQVWSLLSNQLPCYGGVIHRAVVRFLRGYDVARLECTVDPLHPQAVEWAKRLGFRYESTMPKYSPIGTTMDLYVRFR